MHRNHQMTLEDYNRIPIPTAILKNAGPAIIAMLMVLIYNLADTFFIGQTHDALQVAAISIATPVFLVFMAIGTVFGIGGTSVISRAMGEGKQDYAKKVSSFCMWSCIIVGTILSLVFWIFMDHLLDIIGSTQDTREMTRTYLVIVAFSGPFVLIANCFSNILRSEGKSMKAMTGMLLGNLLNVILDPIMILTCGWGIAGAAWATVIGNVVGALSYLIYFWKGESSLSIKLKDCTWREGVMKDVLAIGIPASLGSLLMSVSSIIMNTQMAHYGDMALAGIGVAMKVTMMTGMVCIGFGQGIQPLLGFCVGAKDWERYKKILRLSNIFSLLLGTVLTLICLIFNKQIVLAFLTNEQALSYGISFSKILLSTSFVFGFYYVMLNALQAMGAATESLIINLSRQGLIYIPALFILQSTFGINGLVWAQPAADVLSLVLLLLLYFPALKKKEGIAKKASVK